MTDFTLRVVIGGVTRLVEPMTFARFKKLMPTIEPMIQELTPAGRVAFLAETDDGVTHILGRWR